jgi:hypothetical protein
MPTSPRRLVWLAPLALALASGPARAEDLYPTDRCVAAKLAAAARHCAVAVASHYKGAGTRDALLIGRSRALLASAWESAEATSEGAGVACEETTLGAAAMADGIERRAAAFAASTAPIPFRRPGGITSSKGTAYSGCQVRRTLQAAQACHELVRAEADHLLTRSHDRTRAALEARRAATLDRFEHAWGAPSQSACGGPSGARARAALEALADATLAAALVSPAVPGTWTMITPPARVEYAGRTLEPSCGNGTPWVFFVRRGTVNKLLFYFQGGGACWDYFTCQQFPTYKQTTGPSDDPTLYPVGLNDPANPENPFRDWNAVFVPYCTGDVHWGDSDFVHSRGALSVTMRHRGFVNARVAEKWAREHFVDPEQIFVTGSSAGAYGAIANSIELQENVWPSSPFAVLGDAGNGVITRDFLENDLAKWGVEKNLPAWIPALNRPLTELDAADLWTETALYYPHNRFASYSTAFDGGQGGQIGFYNVMLNPGNVLTWLFWWRPSCEWNAAMRGLVQDAAARAPNYRYYIGAGSRHTAFGHPKVYTDTTGGVPTVVSWIRAMLEGSPEWRNVECSDCGQLLPGDPRPDPAEAPYTEDGRIVCTP